MVFNKSVLLPLSISFTAKKQLFLKRKSHKNRKMSVFSTAIFDKFNYLGFSQGDLTAGQLINR